MEIALITLGAAALVLVNFSVVRTTIGMGRPGGLLLYLAEVFSKTYLRVARWLPTGDGYRAALGPIVLVGTIVFWWIALIAAYLAMFLAAPDSVVDAKTGAPATAAEKLYFLIYTISTLGLGDYVPGATGWKILAAAGSLNGLFVISLSVTYLIPVVSAVVQKRSLAGSVNALGHSPTEIVASLWDGESFARTEIVLVELSRLLEAHSQRHLAYPVVHHFHSADRNAALAPALLNLSVAVDSIRRNVAPSAAPAPYALKLIDQSLDNFAEMIGETFTAESELSSEEDEQIDYESLCIPLRQKHLDDSTQYRQRQTIFRSFATQVDWNQSSER